MTGIRRRCGTIRNIMRRRTRRGSSLTDLSELKRVFFIFISRCCCLLAIFFWLFSLLAMLQSSLQLLLGLTCTYLVAVYISIRGLCSHRHAFIFYAFHLPLIPYSLPPSTPTSTLNLTNTAKPILTVTCTCDPLPFYPPHPPVSTLTFVLFTLRSAPSVGNY